MSFRILEEQRKRPHTVPRGEASLARQHRIVKSAESRNFGIHPLHQQPRDQFRAALHTKLDEDVPQVKLHCLFAHAESFTNLGVCQPFNTTKSYLRLAPAQHHVLSQSRDRPIKGTIALASISPLAVDA